MSAAFGIEVPLGPFEIGPVRFKFGLSADASVAARTDPTTASLGGRRSASAGHDAHHGGRTTEHGRTVTAGVDVAISQNITVGASAELSGDALDRLIANPSPETLTSTLQRCFNAHVQFGSNLTVDLQQDSDFCFSGVRAQFTPAAFGSASVEATGTVAGAIRMGPSRSLMQRLALRSGPALTRVMARALPRMFPSAGGLAASEFFATWAGPIGWAIPISCGIRDALLAVTGAARARGDDQGNCNTFATALVKESYGYPHLTNYGAHSPRVRGIAAARALAARHGWVQVQRRLERDFNGGLPPASIDRLHGHFSVPQLQVMSSRLGEAIFASHEGGEMPRAMERF